MPDLAARVDALDWYHTIDLTPGLATPGEYDLRPIVDRLPLDVAGSRALDVGTHDGFYAFELERRGAREVVAIDLAGPEEIDWPGVPPAALGDAQALVDRRGGAFALAHEARGSAVDLRHVSVYDLDPDAVGTFDLAVIGTLLLHLRDPIGALRAIRGVARRLVVCDVVSVPLTVRHPRTPAARLLAREGLPFWWIPNRAALLRYVEAAGWEVRDASRPFLIPWGEGHRPAPVRQRVRAGGRVLDEIVLTKGAPHVWVRAETRG